MPKIFEYRGVEGLVYAEVTKDNNNTGTGEGYVVGTVKPLAGVAEIGKSTDSSSEAHYYDNIPAVVVQSTGADTVTISASAIPLDVLADPVLRMHLHEFVQDIPYLLDLSLCKSFRNAR
jgi:hypothetical protein